MAYGDSSHSEGEIVENTQKANNGSSRRGDLGFDRSSRGYTRDGSMRSNGHNHRNQSRSPSPFRHNRDRSPSPFRHNLDRSPSPYRHRRTRSPSPYRASRGRDGRHMSSNKRKASPHRHSRPEKRYNSERPGNDDRYTATHKDRGRGGNRQFDERKNRPDVSDSRHQPISYDDEEHIKTIPSFHDNPRTTNGQHRQSESLVSRSKMNKDSVENTHTLNEAQVESKPDAQGETDYTLTTVEEKVITEESREERKRRWAAKRAQLNANFASDGNNLLQQALLTTASEATTPNVASPAIHMEKSRSPSIGSPRVLDMDSVPASPDVMVIDKENNAPEDHSPPTDSPSAANYDPTQDMLDDRRRAEQKVQDATMSAASYDETNPKLLSTLPAEKVKPVKKKKKKEFDMFALSDEEEEEGDGSDGEEEDETQEAGPNKGTVLDAKLLDNWDDPEGYYKIISNELVNGHYRMIKLLGRGVFANVAQAEDVKDTAGRLVAIKIVRKNDAMKKSSQKEMEFVRRLNEADPQDKKHIIQLLGSFDHKGHLCIVFEHMSKNLRDLLKEDTSGRGLSLQAVKTYARQMFSGLKHMQDCQVIHADLKPDNILVSTDKKTIKIADFGTAADKRDNEEPTPYMVSRFYRAPEIILGMEIGYAIDMWAIGCTIFELWTGKILFNGRSNNQMLKVMMESLGWPSEKYLKKGLLSGDFYEAGPPLKFVSKEQDQFQNPRLRKIEQQRTCPRPLKAKVQEAGRDTSPADINELVDLLGACLNWNYEKRIQPKDAMNHKIFVKPNLAPRSAVVKPLMTKRGPSKFGGATTLHNKK